LDGGLNIGFQQQLESISPQDYLNSKSYQDNLKLAEELKRRGKSVMLVLAQLKETFSYIYQI